MSLGRVASEAAALPANATVEAVSTATADSVKTIFNALGPQVAAHPEGQARIENIMRMFDELLAAAK